MDGERLVREPRYEKFPACDCEHCAANPFQIGAWYFDEPPPSPEDPSAVTLVTGSLAFMALFGTFIAFIIYLAFNCPPAHGALALIQTGNVSAAIAAQNRTTIESQTNLVTLPAGQIQLDQALTPRPGTTYDGAGQAVLKNAYTASPYGPNCSLMAYGRGVGYADAITIQSPARISIDDAAAAANYPLNGVAYFYRYDGYFDAIGQLCARRMVKAKDDRLLSLSAGIDLRCNRGKWFSIAAPIVADVRVGQISVSVQTIDQAKQFAAGDHVLITAGADLANADDGELHRVIAVNQFNVQLATTTQRAYKSPVIAKLQPVAGVTFKNLVIDTPINTASSAAFCKYAVGWRLENCTIRGVLAFGGSAHCTLVNCTIDELGVNSCHDFDLVNCRIGRLAMEEGCFNIRATGCTFGPGEVPLQCSVVCERLSFRCCAVTGASNMPVAIGGADIVFDDLEIANSARPLNAYFSGDRLRLTRVRADCAVVLSGGQNMAAADIKATKVWPGWLKSSPCGGTMLDASPLATDDDYRNSGELFGRGAWRP